MRLRLVVVVVAKPETRAKLKPGVVITIPAMLRRFSYGVERVEIAEVTDAP